MSGKSELENTGIISEKLIASSVAWNGSALPNYPAGTPYVSIYKFIFPPHSVTNPHFHEIISCGVVLSGTLTIVNNDGSSHDVHSGEALVETVGEIHHGENRGDVDTVVIIFYAGEVDSRLSVAVEE